MAVMRIVSLLPSATEMVAAIGLADSLVGVTHECDHPPGVASLPHVTRTLIPADATSSEIDALVSQQMATRQALYSLDAELLSELKPDLIVTQSLCDVCAVAPSEIQAAIARLPSRLEVIDLEPMSLNDVLVAMLTIGEATGHESPAAQAVSALRDRVETVRRAAVQRACHPRSLILEWIDPPFCAGHWNPELVQLAGGREMIGRAGEPSRRIEWEEIIRADPEFLLVACCGYSEPRARDDLPLLEARPGWQSLTCVRAGRVFVADGSAYFNRPGPRLVDSLELLAGVILDF